MVSNRGTVLATLLMCGCHWVSPYEPGPVSDTSPTADMRSDVPLAASDAAVDGPAGAEDSATTRPPDSGSTPFDLLFIPDGLFVADGLLTILDGLGPVACDDSSKCGSSVTVCCCCGTLCKQCNKMRCPMVACVQ